MITENERKIWQLSLGITSLLTTILDVHIIRNHSNFWSLVRSNIELTPDIIYGVPQTQDDAKHNKFLNHLNYFMGSCLKIHSLEDWKSSLSEYESGSKTRKSYNRIAHQLLTDLSKDESRYKNILDNQQSQTNIIAIIKKYLLVLPPCGILAFDLSNYISLCRLGAYKKYISIEEMFNLIKPAALTAQKNYESFEEFATASLVGNLIFCTLNELKQQEYYIQQFKESMRYDKGYFSNLDWKSELEPLGAIVPLGAIGDV